MTIEFSIESLSEDTLLLRFGDVIDTEINPRVHAAARALREAGLPGLIDVAPAYASLLVRFDPSAWVDPRSTQPFRRIEACMRPAIDAAIGGHESAPPLPQAALPPGGEEARSAERAALGEGAAATPPLGSTTNANLESSTPSARRARDDECPPPHPALSPEREAVRGRGFERVAASDVVEIPVCYGGNDGPDLAAVAEHAHLTSEQVIARHATAEYTVAMLGFAPGFPYLLGLDPALMTPRRATPRTRVPAGSVAIGGAQTGIYPRELPGGWWLIGRTPRVLFDPLRDPPCLLAPGDRVRFHPISTDEFARLAQDGG